jgi:hypothetical protein
MTSGSIRRPEDTAADAPTQEPEGEVAPPQEVDGELAQVRAERDAALAKLDKRERRRQIGGMARRITVGVLVALAAILIPLTATVTWAHRTILNTDEYVSTVAPLAKDPAVTSTLARVATDQLFTALNPQPTIANALPPRAAFLAGPITSGVKGFINDKANVALSSQQFQQIWTNANRTAHTALVNVLRGKSKALVESNGQVVLSLVPLLNQVLQSVQQTAGDLVGKDVKLPTLTGTELPSQACAKISAAINRPLPSTCGEIPLFPADKLDQAQGLVRAFDRLMIALLIVSPLLVVAALLLTRRRRRTLLQIAVGTLLVMVIFRRAVIWLQDKLISTGNPANEAARKSIVDQLLSGFFTASVWILSIALAVTVVALITGPYRWAVTSRNWVRAQAVAGWRVTRDAVSGKSAAGQWVLGHIDLLRVAGGLLAVLLLLVVNVSWVGLLIIVVLLAGYEFWLYRLAAAARPAAHPKTAA